LHACSVGLAAGRSAFLWGPRQVGKTTLLRNRYGGSAAHFIDLLETDVFAEYAAHPALLRERHRGHLTVIDEIQKIPALLDEVHLLIENGALRSS
jgi:predicted AAA+ superfamily ATPase